MRMQPTPLKGKRIVLTRTPEQSRILLHKLKDSGAQIILLPCIEFRPPEDFAPLDSALDRLAEFDWLVFTSQNAVRFFSQRLRELGRDTPHLHASRPRVAAIGIATRDTALQEGWKPEFAAADARSSSEFATEFARTANGKKILLPQSVLATPHLAEGLREGGATVTPVVAYRTCVPESLDGERLNRLCREGADAIVFASPSAFRNFAQAAGRDGLERLIRDVAFAAIGPTTAQAIRIAGVPVAMEAAKPNADEIVQAMTQYFSSAHHRKASR
jgi:uroporphyrinogen III methyltransferase / synthase